MTEHTSLHEWMSASARRFPDQTAVIEPGGRSITYRELDTLSDALRDRLRSLGAGPGHRVGFYLFKSIDSIIAIYGILKSGAAYVPVDPNAPAARNAFIMNNCDVSAIIVHDSFMANLERELRALGKSRPGISIEYGAQPSGIAAWLAENQQAAPAPPAASHKPAPDDLAYILYTSGSTGMPKGVMLNHRNAASFVSWCADTFTPSHEDRFSSHAPLHFDLSILDIHLAMKSGATLVLVDEKTGKDPASLAALIAGQKITIWYSAPSILGMLAQYGGLENHDYSSLRQVLFAGEVFPVKHLRLLKQHIPAPRYFNLYGPTETNVCTYYEIPETIPEDRTKPYPIGKCCSHLLALTLDENGGVVPSGVEGELLIHGPAVTTGYWNLPEANARAFWKDGEDRMWYRTGDLVIEEPDGNYTFLGRRDRMVKKRGYRIELGEIEACLYQQPQIKEAGVVSVPDEDNGVKIVAFIVADEENKPSIVGLKSYCASRLPLYMIPDLFTFRPALPKTSTAKIDYQKLKEGV